MPALTPSTSTTTQKVLDTVGRVLAPLARLMIAKGVTFQMASEVMKRAYVQAAQKHFVEADDAASGTKLSLLTGLNRKEIRRLTSEDDKGSRTPVIPYATAVIVAWRNQRRWHNKDGTPKALARRTSGNQLSFDDLVRSVTTDHRPSAVFDELHRLGYVSINNDDKLMLSSEYFKFSGGIDEKLDRLSDNIADHLTAVVVNVTAPEPRFLERAVFADELSVESTAKLREFTAEHWENIQNQFFTKATALEKNDADTGKEQKSRVRVGMYLYSE